MDPATVFRNKTVLEIGAGECGYSSLIVSRFSPRKVIACELFRERMLPAAGQNTHTALSFVAGDSYRLPFQGESCDVIWGSGVLNSLRGLTEVVAEIHRVLKPKGLYIGFESNSLNLGILYRYLFRPRSQNQYLLQEKDLVVFQRQGFELQTTFFYARFPKLRNKLLATCVGIRAQKI
jgi:ubiquinone/menaquinone biosynthesis C-methylase UbiE